MYIKRHAEATIQQLSKMFGAILVAGPRQVGKTTMLQAITKDMGYVTLDDPIIRATAQEQSGTFFKDNPPPVFIDEIQKAPGLFPQIKMLLDSQRKKGQFFMCGSQQFKMMKNVSESLAGRLGLLTLLGFSLLHNLFCQQKITLQSTTNHYLISLMMKFGILSIAVLCLNFLQIRTLTGKCITARMCAHTLNVMSENSPK